MRQLTYISTATMEMNDTEMADILATSRRNNATRGVSGLLLYDGRRFLQALEGEAAEVAATYHRIMADPRHRAIVLLASRDVPAPMFGAWSMAAQRVSTGRARSSLAEQVDALTTELADANLRATFRGFARLRSAA